MPETKIKETPIVFLTKCEKTPLAGSDTDALVKALLHNYNNIDNCNTKIQKHNEWLNRQKELFNGK